jgi:hypothetical protein
MIQTHVARSLAGQDDVMVVLFVEGRLVLDSPTISSFQKMKHRSIQGEIGRLASIGPASPEAPN